MTIYTKKILRESDGTEFYDTILEKVTFDGNTLNVYNNLVDSADEGILSLVQPFNPVPRVVVDSAQGQDSNGNPYLIVTHQPSWESEEEAINWWNQQ